MTMSMEKQSVFASVRAVLADSLAIEADAIRLDSALIDELGADSLDFLDILFALEKRFSVKLRNSDLDTLLRADFAPGKLVDREFLPREDVERLAEWMPGLPSAPDLNRITPRSLFSYLTVESLVILIGRKLGERGAGGAGEAGQAGAAGGTGT
jgi:acyl carrier protein